MVNEWWGELLGAGDECSLDTESDFIVCCNYLGSPYGSSSPVTPDPAKPDGRWYAADFPTPVTIRDNVRLQRKLLAHLVCVPALPPELAALYDIDGLVDRHRRTHVELDLSVVVLERLRQ